MQILIWGDYMKRKISICILLTIFAFFLSFFAINDVKKPIGETQKQTQKESTERILPASHEFENEYLYMVTVSEGRLVVYKNDGSKDCMETGIRLSDLPDELQEKLKSDIGFATEMELIEFLENYAS